MNALVISGSHLAVWRAWLRDRRSDCGRRVVDVAAIDCGCNCVDARVHGDVLEARCTLLHACCIDTGA